MHEYAELPPPSPELVALRVLAEAHWRALKPRQRLAFQKTVSELLAEMEEAPLTFTAPSELAKAKAARARAQAWLRRTMGDMLRKG